MVSVLCRAALWECEPASGECNYKRRYVVTRESDDVVATFGASFGLALYNFFLRADLIIDKSADSRPQAATSDG